MPVYTNVHRPGYREYRAGSTSPRPWTSNNRYSHTIDTYSGSFYLVDAEITNGPDQNQYNDLYRKFADSARGNSSQLLTCAAEWESSLTMIHRRAVQVRKAFNALRRFDLPKVLEHLSLSEKLVSERRVKKKMRMQRPTEAWLEYWMGWAPMYSDMYNAIDIIQKPNTDEKINVGVSRNYRTYDVKSASWFREATSRTSSITMAAYAKARVTNHNLFIANRMGLVNPLQTAWEVVPFSFAVDWALNLGQVLGSLTDFAGLDLYDQGTAMLDNTSSSFFGSYRVYENGQYHEQHVTGNGRHVYKYRNPGSISPPSLSVRFPRLSLTRAATSVSLMFELSTLSKRELRNS